MSRCWIGLLVFVTALFTDLVLGHQENLTLSPSNLQVVRYSNESYIVSCNGETGSKVKWVSPEGREVTNHTGRVHIEDRSQTALALVFEYLTISDAGTWTCKEDGNKSRTIAFNISVFHPMSFIDMISAQTASEGKNFTVKCIAKGDPKPQIIWSFNGKPINTTVDKNSTLKFQKVDKGLFIKNVTLSDKGRYTCKALQVSPSMSNIMQEHIELNVQHKPIPVKSLPMHANAEPAYGYMSGTVNLTCAATAEPAANFMWSRKNKPVAKSSGKIFEDTHVSVLQVDLKDKSDLGDYVCEARNFMGTMKRVITLFEGHRPEIPTQMTLKEAHAEGLLIKIDGPIPPEEPYTITPQPNNLPIIGYKFQIMRAPTILDNISVPKTSPEMISNDVADLVSSSTQIPEEINEELWKNAKDMEFDYDRNGYLLEGLEQETLYAVRVMSRNAAGCSYPSRTSYYRTLKLQPRMFGDASSLQINTILLSFAIVTSLTAILFSTLTCNTCFRVKHAIAPSAKCC